MKKYLCLTVICLGLWWNGNSASYSSRDGCPGVMYADCVNPTFGGKIDYLNHACKDKDPLPLISISLPSGYTGTLEYKWQMSVGNPDNFVDIPKSNSAVYDPPVLPTVTWFKRLARVDCMPDWNGAAESNIIYVKVKAPPVIIEQPSNVAACWWEKVFFSVKATGDEIHFQWYKKGNPDIKLKDGGNIWGTTSNMLVISNPVIQDAKDYYVIVYNNYCDPVQSKVAKLAVKELVVSPKSVQFTDPVTMGVVLHNGESGFPDYTSVMLYVNGAPLTSVPIPLAISSPNKKAAFTRPVSELPGMYSVTAEFKNDKNTTQGCIPKMQLYVNYEDAWIEYSGTLIQSTASANSGKAMVQLMAVFREFYDGYHWQPGWPVPCITFTLYDWEDFTHKYSVTAHVIPQVSTFGYMMGVASAMLEVDIGSDDFTSFLMKTGPYGCKDPYTCINCPVNTLLVYKPVGDFITGGGYIHSTDTSGVFPGIPDSKINFGFHVKYNKMSTNLIGGMNIVYRREIKGGIHDFQIKSNKIISLGVENTWDGIKRAEFTAKANLKDITAGTDVEGNLRLLVSLVDKGEPGINDLLGFTLWRINAKGEYTTLLYSTAGTDFKASVRKLDGGNLLVHAGFPADTLNGKIKIASADLADQTGNLQVYPNPFHKKVTFEFVPKENTSARIDIFDLTGRKISTPFNQTVMEGTPYQAEFTPDSKVNAVYLYRFTIGNQVIHDKIHYKK